MLESGSEPKSGPADRWTLDYGGHRIEVGADEEKRLLRLWVDREEAAIVDDPPATFCLGDGDVLVELKWKYGHPVERVALVVGEIRVPLDPPSGMGMEPDEEGRQASALAEAAAEGKGDKSVRPVRGRQVDPWSGRSAGRQIEVTADGESEQLWLWVEGKRVAVVQGTVGRVRFGGAGVLVDARTKLGGAIKRAELLSPGEGFPLDPPDTKEGRRELARRARRESWRRSRVYSWGRAINKRWQGSKDSPWRHAVRGVARVALPLIGVAALFSFLPDIPLPDVHLDLPSIPFPELPTITLPGWLAWVLEHSHYIVPILIGLTLTLLEIRRRRAGHADPRTPTTRAERLARRFLGPGRD